ncbi:lipase 1-like [Wyeomyia smithii]|uniref:lipase 1-like n=1 Tax=Wyeomyia smithii TaxID=174621 RepID=UPI002468103F|nr:lipase 1-like [Wyeomyia smithii]
MAAICWWIFFFCCIISANSGPAWDEDLDTVRKENDIQSIDVEDGEMTVPQLIHKYGYRMENHVVITEDGYILTMFRIFQKHSSEKPKLPVLIVHGLFGSSADFVISGPNNSLAYLLADDGYEVWLANVRGTRYSRNHTSIMVETKEYWDFSWHEIGYYDLPTMIDYILDKSKVSKLYYIGHSQGTTTYFAMSCSRPNYNDKIALMIALSPAVVLKRVRSPILRVMLNLADKIEELLNALNIVELLPYNENTYRIAKHLCPVEEPNNLCNHLIGQITGPHPEMYDQKLGLAYMGHSPSGASTKQLSHFTQVARSGLFRQYDYGKRGNLQTYSDWKPPTYNLNASIAPVVIFYGLNDWMVHPKDVQQFATMLPRLVSANVVADKKFNHLDFILAKNARSQVYDKLIPLLNQNNNV